MNKTPIIGIHGKKRSGKDTIGKFIASLVPSKKTHSFALPVKETTAKMFGISIDTLMDGPEREIVDSFWGISPRKMLQLVGTDCARNIIRNDIWIKRMEMEYLASNDDLSDLFIITDTRFENEADWIRSQNGTIFHVIRPELTEISDSHESECGIDVKDNDIVILNDGGISDLLIVVNDVMRREFGLSMGESELDSYLFKNYGLHI